MSKRENFTAGRIAGFKCEPGKTQHIFWDGKTPGLGLRVTPAGIKSFVFETRLNGKTLRMTIGDARTWAIDAAQQEATRLKAMADQGDDPRLVRAEKAAAIEAKRRDSIHADQPALVAWQAYVTDRSAKWGAATLRDHQRFADAGGRKITRGRKKNDKGTTEPGVLFALLSQPLVTIDSDAVRAWLKKEVPLRPTVSSLAYRLLRAFLNWCAERPEYRNHMHADACAPRVARDELPKKGAKDDCLQREQLPLWFEHVRKLNYPVHSAFLQALLLTGARREELAGLQWADVDFQWKSLAIKDKVEGSRTIPLTPYVASLLAVLPRRNEWVFSSPTAASGRLMEPRIGHNKALTAAGLPALTLHGLRRSFGTLAEWVECPAGVSAQIMGHKPSATAEKHYRRRPLDLLRMWHTKIEGWILEQAGIEFVPEKAGLQLVQNSA